MISFVSMYVIMYYGLSLLRQYREIESNIYVDEFEEAYSYNVLYQPDAYEINGVEKTAFGKGNILYRSSLPVGEDAGLSIATVHTLIEKNEELHDRITYDSTYNSSKGFEEPSCIISDFWKSKVITENDTEYIFIAGKTFRVVGIYETIAFENSDKRILVFGDSLTEEQLAYMLDYNRIGEILYQSYENNSVRDSFENWLLQYFDRESISSIGFENEMYFYEKFDFERYSGWAKKCFAVVALFCAVNAAFLAYVWGRNNLHKEMIKLTFGYRKTKIMTEIFSEIAVYEAASLLAAGLITLVFEIINGRLKEWAANVAFGAVYAAGIVLAFIVILTVSASVYLVKNRPADILKTNE